MGEEFGSKGSNVSKFTTIRRVITMKYNKPEIAKLADAVIAIQGPVKFEPPHDHTSDITAAGAYEADE